LRIRSGFLARLAARVSIVILAAGIAGASAGSANAASYAGIVMDAKTGKVLYAHRESARQGPASLTKMMTLYMLFEAMQAGKVGKNTRIKVSKHAASMPPSKLGVRAGGSVTAEQAILALVTRSANDIAAAVGEHLGGSESKFAQMMTSKARSLGMKSTTFKNASGLPNSGQLTTARDMAILGIALREHYPQYYGYFATRSFKYGKQRIGNHNRLLGVVKGVDGIKTGYTRASGFNLVSSAQRDGRSIVAVVLGGSSGKARNQQMSKLIAKYLPKASRGGDSLIVAKPRGKTSYDTPVEVADASAAVPEKRPAEISVNSTQDPVEQRIATAHIVSAVTSEEDQEAFDIAQIEKKLREISKDRMPVPTPAPQSGRVDPIVTAAAAQTPDVEPAAFAPEIPFAVNEAPQQAAPIPAGWQIQIGAAPSLEGAHSLLERARTNAPRLLSDVANHTETVAKGGTTLFRARFAGFASKNDAQTACNQLKKKKFDCIALSN
jgi:D-alanyl-D-alanine carboxypeptidase